MSGNKGSKKAGGAPKSKVKLKSKTETRQEGNNKRLREEGDFVGRVFDRIEEAISPKELKDIQKEVLNSKISLKNKRHLSLVIQDKLNFYNDYLRHFSNYQESQQILTNPWEASYQTSIVTPKQTTAPFTTTQVAQVNRPGFVETSSATAKPPVVDPATIPTLGTTIEAPVVDPATSRVNLSTVSTNNPVKIEGLPTTVTNMGKKLLSWLNRHPTFTIAATVGGLGTGVGRTALQGIWKGSLWSPDWFSNNEKKEDNKGKNGLVYVLIGDRKVPAVIGNDGLIRISLENPQQPSVEAPDSIDTFQDPGIRVDTLSNDSIASLWR